MPAAANPPRDHIALAFLVAMNLIPIVGVLWLDWDLASIIVLYWLENLVVGFYTILKMLHLKGLAALFPAAFFCLHYGAFCGVHGMFVLMFTSEGGMAGDAFPSGEEAWPAHLAFIQMLVMAVQRMLNAAAPGVVLAWFGLFVSHGLSLLLNYFQGGEYRRSEIKTLMSAPYKRIAVLHVAIIAGGWGIMVLGSPLVLLIALVALKIALDISLHRNAHRDAGSITS